MPSRLSNRLLAVVAASLFAACARPAPWAEADWQPASPPQRIVAGSLLATEVLLEILPPDRLAGVHVLAGDPRFSLVAKEVAHLPMVGAEAEQVLATRPDLVLCDAYTRPETLALLAQADIPVVVTADPASFDDIAANIARIGRVVHRPNEAAAVVERLRARLRELAAKAPDVAAWRVMNLDGGLHTYGRGSLFAAVVQAAGARCEAVERGVGPFRKLDAEALLGWQPDALVVNGDGGSMPAWIAQHPALPLLRCVARNRVLAVPGPLFNTTSHRLVEAAEFLQRGLVQWGSP
ncbi:MAG: ABC transporter substrate-binding protein [Planctomycetota bacterium]